MLSGLRERFPPWMIDLFFADFDGLLSGGSREREVGAVSRIDTEACCFPSNRPNRSKNVPNSPLQCATIFLSRVAPFRSPKTNIFAKPRRTHANVYGNQNGLKEAEA
jgi:hypothetical protein